MSAILRDQRRSPVRSGRLSQDLSNLRRQLNWTERLMQDRYAPVKYATLSNYIRRVARHKQHLQVRTYFLHPFGRLLPADSGHYRSEEHTSELQSPCNL